MTLTTAFKTLERQLHTLREDLIGLRTNIIEDKPVGEEVVFVSRLGDAVDDLLGWLEEILLATGQGQQAVEPGPNLNYAWRALIICQEQFNHLVYRFFDLISYDHLAPLMHFGRQHNGEWRAWANSVKEGLDRCQQPIYDVNQALFHCWQELAERAGLTAVSVQTTNIGQQITIPEGREGAQEVIP